MTGLLDLGIDIDVWPWIWLSVAVIFALIELTFLGGTFVLLPFAASAFISALLGFYDMAIEVQWTVFVLGGGVLFAAMYRWVRRFIARHELPSGVGADRLIGLTGFVLVPIEPDDSARRGRVSIEGEVWGALPSGDGVIESGRRVRITGVVGTRVVVSPISAPPPSGEGPIPNPEVSPEIRQDPS